MNTRLRQPECPRGRATRWIFCFNRVPIAYLQSISVS